MNELREDTLEYKHNIYSGFMWWGNYKTKIFSSETGVRNHFKHQEYLWEAHSVKLDICIISLIFITTTLLVR